MSRETFNTVYTMTILFWCVYCAGWFIYLHAMIGIGGGAIEIIEPRAWCWRLELGVAIFTTIAAIERWIHCTIHSD